MTKKKKSMIKSMKRSKFSNKKEKNEKKLVHQRW